MNGGANIPIGAYNHRRVIAVLIKIRFAFTGVLTLGRTRKVIPPPLCTRQGEWGLMDPPPP